MADEIEMSFVVVVCTRNRPELIQPTLDAILGQERGGFDLVVVDQSDEVGEALRARADAEPRMRIIHDHGRGLSRARNVAWRETTEDWILFVDDDCLIAPDYTARFEEVLAEHPEVVMISGHIGGRTLDPQPDDMQFSTSPVEHEQVYAGHWTHPSLVGFGVCYAIRRSIVDTVQGWDERLGPGAPHFPAADDMDFNLRVLRAGGVTLRTPRMRAEHDQWRTRDEVVDLYAGYMAAWMGLCAKLLKTGEPRTALWLWWEAGPRFVFQVLASGLKRRSRFRVRVALRSFAAMVTGGFRALARSW